MVDNYCNNMAETFLEANKDALLDEQINWQFRSHMLVKGADKQHSGHRFYESLYRKMNLLDKKVEETEPTGQNL